MRFDPWKVAFPPDDVRTTRPLGRYYQDFGPAVSLVTGGVHGPMDEGGRPLVRREGGEAYHNAIIIAQYALALLPDTMEGDPLARERLRIQADWLVAAQERSGPRRGFWVQRFDNPKYPALKAPWVSALAQGNALSALLRAQEVLGADEYGSAARLAWDALSLSVKAGGVRWEEGHDVWLEEYPLDPAGHVLNGAVYALWGVLDFARATDEPTAWDLWRKGAATLARHVRAFDTGYWTRYELATPELVSLHYHKNIHLPQMEVMHTLTGEQVFSDVHRRWSRYLGSPLCHLRRRLSGRSRWKRSAAVERRRPDSGTGTP